MEAYDKAVSLLAMREHTEKEIREKLSARSFSPEDIDSAIGRLRREGLLSEERFAEVFIRSRLRKLPEGRALLPGIAEAVSSFFCNSVLVRTDRRSV